MAELTLETPLSPLESAQNFAGGVPGGAKVQVRICCVLWLLPTCSS